MFSDYLVSSRAFTSCWSRWMLFHPLWTSQICEPIYIRKTKKCYFLWLYSPYRWKTAGVCSIFKDFPMVWKNSTSHSSLSQSPWHLDSQNQQENTVKWKERQGVVVGQICPSQGSLTMRWERPRVQSFIAPAILCNKVNIWYFVCKRVSQFAWDSIITSGLK